MTLLLLKEIFPSLIPLQFTDLLLIVKDIFLIFSLFLLGFIIYTFIKTSWLKRMIIWDLQEFLSYRPYGLRKVERQWQEIKKKLEMGMESEWKLAVIEADKILDNALNRMGFGGADLGERLTKLTAVSLPNIEEIKEAHKIRDNIIHDANYRISLEDVRRVVAIYEKALTDLHSL